MVTRLGRAVIDDEIGNEDGDDENAKRDDEGDLGSDESDVDGEEMGNVDESGDEKSGLHFLSHTVGKWTNAGIWPRTWENYLMWQQRLAHEVAAVTRMTQTLAIVLAYACEAPPENPVERERLSLAATTTVSTTSTSSSPSAEPPRAMSHFADTKSKCVGLFFYGDHDTNPALRFLHTIVCDGDTRPLADTLLDLASTTPVLAAALAKKGRGCDGVPPSFGRTCCRRSVPRIPIASAARTRVSCG
jgi:hypothetical protein